MSSGPLSSIEIETTAISSLVWLLCHSDNDEWLRFLQDSFLQQFLCNLSSMASIGCKSPTPTTTQQWNGQATIKIIREPIGTIKVELAIIKRSKKPTFNDIVVWLSKIIKEKKHFHSHRAKLFSLADVVVISRRCFTRVQLWSVAWSSWKKERKKNSYPVDIRFIFSELIWISDAEPGA